MAWHWPGMGTPAGKAWPGTGLALARHWPGTGPALARHGTGPARHWPGVRTACARLAGGRGMALCAALSPVRPPLRLRRPNSRHGRGWCRSQLEGNALCDLPHALHLAELGCAARAHAHGSSNPRAVSPVGCGRARSVRVRQTPVGAVRYALLGLAWRCVGHSACSALYATTRCARAARAANCRRLATRD